MDEFLKTSQKLGENILFAQSTGGNTSIKIKDKMYIKASGYKLKEMKSGFGYTCCAYKRIATFFTQKLTNNKSHERDYIDVIQSQIIADESYGKPSMETGFHVIIP